MAVGNDDARDLAFAQRLQELFALRWRVYDDRLARLPVLDEVGVVGEGAQRPCFTSRSWPSSCTSMAKPPDQADMRIAGVRWAALRQTQPAFLVDLHGEPPEVAGPPLAGRAEDSR